MLYSGADLLRTSGPQAERLSRLKVVDPIAPVSQAEKSHTSLEEDTQNALLRFARFIHKEGQPKKKSPPAKPTARAVNGLPVAYANQIQLGQGSEGPGALLDIIA